MDIRSLVSWNRRNRSVPVRRAYEHPMVAFDRTLDDVFHRWMESFWSGPLRSIEPFDGFWPRIDVSETDTGIEISAELPGMDENDIDVSLSKDSLTIKGKKIGEKGGKRKGYFATERSYGMFHRTILVGDRVDLDLVSATFKKGVLKVVLPKTDAARRPAKQIPVKVA